MKKLISFCYPLFFLTLLLITQNSFAQQTIYNSSEETRPLLVGQTTPNITLVNLEGKEVKLLDLLKEKPTVLVFFRGGWCPYCHAQLIDLRKALPMIEELGYQLLAVSPDTFEKSADNLKSNELNFKLLSDPNLEAITTFGLAYKAPADYAKTLRDYSNGKNTGVIPIPTVYIVNKEGLIQFQYANTDFKKRLKSETLINVLKTL